ncbi:AaceriAER442Wp [[Ashbya] aceris (nom. inval.)]|nr:AaceriAER442Wp [[Ashbya] aceris (nom. inval.)]
MSFIFNRETFEDNSFNEVMREKLMRALNLHDRTVGSGGAATTGSGAVECSGAAAAGRGPVRGKGGFSKVDILKSGIIVKKVEFPTIPKLEILDLDVSIQSKSLIKGICKVSCRDAMVQITTEIESNLLLLHVNSSPKFTTPKLISNDSFTVPITMTFDKLHLEAITNIFVKNTGVGISFNDVNLDFRLQCSIKLLQSSIEKRLKASMEEVFKDVLPSVIFNMSQRWFTHGETVVPRVDQAMVSADAPLQPRMILDESDLSDLSPANMLRLSTLVSSRQTLCLNPTAVNTISTIPGCLERQNLHRFNLRFPSLYNYYSNKEQQGAHNNEKNRVEHLKLWGRSSSNPIPTRASFKVENTLPKEVLDSNSYDVRVITAIQTKMYERASNDVVVRRRKIKMKSRKPNKPNKDSATSSQNAPDTSAYSSATSDLSHATLPAESQPDEVGLPPQATSNESGVHKKETEHSGLRAPQDFPVLENVTPVLAQLPNQQRSGIGSPLSAGRPTPHLNLLEDSHWLLQKRDPQELRTTLYSPIRSGRFYVMPQPQLDTKEASAFLLENGKRFGFVGLLNNHNLKWGNDPPPPYREVSTTQ